MYNDADIETLEFEDAARWGYCSVCGDEVQRKTMDAEDRCKRCVAEQRASFVQDKINAWNR